MPQFDSDARPYGLVDALAKLLQGEKKEAPKSKPIFHLITDTYEKVSVSDTAEALPRPSLYTVEHAIALRFNLNYAAVLNGNTLSIPFIL